MPEMVRSCAYMDCVLQAALLVSQLNAVLSLGDWRELLDDRFMVGNFSVIGFIRYFIHGRLCVLLVPGGAVYRLYGIVCPLAGSHVLVRVVECKISAPGICGCLCPGNASAADFNIGV